MKLSENLSAEQAKEWMNRRAAAQQALHVIRRSHHASAGTTQDRNNIFTMYVADGGAAAYRSAHL
jgi:hypothetical protein